jgi:D-alanyl-D-alanine carboxypeptidase/D-alanyl-D-alanine-endopeptidase (penicillin-binding protein 4)
MLIFLMYCSFLIPFSWASDLTIQGIHGFIENGAYILQIHGKKRRSFNTNAPLIPASTIKILTGLMALETLGPQHRFSTSFYQDDVGNLYVKGDGDPFLTSEAIAQITWQLKQFGIETIHSLIFDSSAYELEGPPNQSANTDNPYDASSAALAVNFNTLSFTVANNKEVISGESQTPTLPIMKNLGSLYPQGTHRINVDSMPATGQLTNTIRYCGELFTALLQQQGITVSHGFTSGKIPESAVPVFVYTSEKSVADLVRLCLQYSTNFIANQLFLACGAKKYGYPATWKKAILAGRQYRSQQLGLTSPEIHQVDGSGLSTRNKITAAAMLTLLEEFDPYANLLPKQRSMYIKSGTLTDVYTYAGYFRKSEKLSPFVIILNQKLNNRDIILKRLEHEFHTIAGPP